MAQQTINTGSSPNSRDGDSLRAAFTKINTNFDELYSALGLGDAAISIGAFEFSGSTMTTTDSSSVVIDQSTVITSDLTIEGDLNIGGISISVDGSGNLLVDEQPLTVTSLPWTSVTGKPSFSTVATSGDYADLLNKPTIPTVPTNVSGFVNDANFIILQDVFDAGFITSAGQSSFTLALDDSTSITVANGDTLNLYGTNGIYVQTNAAGGIELYGPGSDISDFTDNSKKIVDFANIDRDLIPYQDVQYDIGSATKRFRDLYLSGSTIDLGGTTLSVVGGELQLGGVKVPTQADVAASIAAATTPGFTYSELDGTSEISVTADVFDFGDGKTIDMQNSTVLFTGSTVSGILSLNTDYITIGVGGSINIGATRIREEFVEFQGASQFSMPLDGYRSQVALDIIGKVAFSTLPESSSDNELLVVNPGSEVLSLDWQFWNESDGTAYPITNIVDRLDGTFELTIPGVDFREIVDQLDSVILFDTTRNEDPHEIRIDSNGYATGIRSLSGVASITGSDNDFLYLLTSINDGNSSAISSNIVMTSVGGVKNTLNGTTNFGSGATVDFTNATITGNININDNEIFDGAGDTGLNIRSSDAKDNVYIYSYGSDGDGTGAGNIYVKSDRVEIYSDWQNGGAGEKKWTFDNTGNLTLPNGAVLRDSSTDSIAFGGGAGASSQGGSAVAIGEGAGNNTQGNQAIAVGRGSGNYQQGVGAIGVGFCAGATEQGDYAVAIGFKAARGNMDNDGTPNQPANSIMINASSTPLNGDQAGLYINPVREDVSNTTKAIYYNTTTKELTYANPTGGGGSGDSLLSDDTDITISIENANSTPGNTLTWTFGREGDLTLPRGDIVSSDDISLIINSLDSTSYRWNFNQLGLLEIPDVNNQLGGTIGDSYGDGGGITIKASEAAGSYAELTNGDETAGIYVQGDSTTTGSNAQVVIYTNNSGGMEFTGDGNAQLLGDLALGSIKSVKGINERTTRSFSAGVLTINNNQRNGSVINVNTGGGFPFPPLFTANFTVNLTGFTLQQDHFTTVRVEIEQHSSAGYYPNVLQIDGVAQTINWEGGVNPAPIGGTRDLVVFYIRNTSATIIPAYSIIGHYIGGTGGSGYTDSDVATYLNGNLDTAIVPDTNSAYDLGTAEKKFRDLYLSSSTIYLGTNTISGINDTLTWNGTGGITAVGPIKASGVTAIEGTANGIIHSFASNYDEDLNPVVIQLSAISPGVDQITADWIVTYKDGVTTGTIKTVTYTELVPGDASFNYYELEFVADTYPVGDKFPLTIQSPDYETASVKTRITSGEFKWRFDEDGDVWVEKPLAAGSSTSRGHYRLFETGFSSDTNNEIPVYRGDVRASYVASQIYTDDATSFGINIATSGAERNQVLIVANGTNSGSLPYPYNKRRISLSAIGGYIEANGILQVEDGVHEKFQQLANATGVVTHDCSAGHIFYQTLPVADWTANLTNINLITSYATTVSIVIQQPGASAFIPTTVQIDGTAQTINWAGGSPPSGTIAGIDVVEFSILRVGTSSYIILGQLASF